MFFIVLPILVVILATSTLFLMKEPTTMVYSIVIGIDFIMVFAMIKGYLLYIKTTHEIRDKEFAEEMTDMVKRIHEHREKFSREALVQELEQINRMINDYNLLREDIIVEPIDIQDFLQRPDEEPE